MDTARWADVDTPLWCVRIRPLTDLVGAGQDLMDTEKERSKPLVQNPAAEKTNEKDQIQMKDEELDDTVDGHQCHYG